MAKAGIAVVENLYDSLGDYCYIRVARHFMNDFDCIRIDARREGFPCDVGAWARKMNIAGVVLDGSEKSPFDDEQWIREEEKFVAECFRLRISLLGICFGHEVITNALGGKLHKGEVSRVELDNIEVLAEDPLFTGLSPEFICPSAHSVRTVAMPEGFVHIARCAKCEMMGMRHPDFPFYGVQFHPEADAEIKIHDPDWEPVTDEEFARSDGDSVLRNFAHIVLCEVEKKRSPEV